MSAKTRLLGSSFAVAALTGLISSSALAVQDADFRFDSTENLVQVCSVPETAPEYLTATLACKAFIEATVQYHDEVTNRKQLKPLICPPKTATTDEGRTAFLAWAQQKAGDKKLMAEQPVVSLVRALAAKYPCKK
ncbi:MAG: Rap1a/Tai family immunity protein [Chromatiaceae bacterium]